MPLFSYFNYIHFAHFPGLTKIGVEVAFLNFNLRSKSLLHCFNVSGAKTLIVGKGKRSFFIFNSCISRTGNVWGPICLSV